jgi:hypothetical protein
MEQRGGAGHYEGGGFGCGVGGWYQARMSVLSFKTKKVQG